MKSVRKTLLTLIICSKLVLMGFSVKAFAGSFEKYSFQDDLKHLSSYLTSVEEAKQDYVLLSLSKVFMINGDLNKAQYFLDKIQKPNSKVALIKRYYQGMINFLNDDYIAAYQKLDYDRFYESSAYPNVCLLKITTMMAIPEKVPGPILRREYNRCHNRTIEFSSTEHFWTNTLTLFRSHYKDALNGKILESYRYVLEDIDLLRIWLKAGLIMNKQEVLAKFLPSVNPSFYESAHIRELIGLVYFRLGKFEDAFKYVEDLNTPNAQNLLGLIKVKEEKLELALGHFQLALKKKKNSLNALRHALALTWILEQWNIGTKLVDKVHGSNFKWEHKLALKGAFHAFLGEYKQLHLVTSLLESQYPNKVPFEVELLRAFSGIISDNFDRFESGSHEGCKSHDGMSCYFSHKFIQDPNFTYSVKRKEKIIADINIDLEGLTQDIKIDSLNEIPLIFQRDIREMDNRVGSIEDANNLFKFSN
ncbi:MAG: tetratricopeptide repeat protein [Bacteriovoracaceae bacterium]